jgi:hypothetical protein
MSTDYQEVVESTVPFQPYSIAKVNKIRHKIENDETALSLLGDTLTGTKIQAIATSLRPYFSAAVSVKTLKKSLRHRIDCKLTRSSLKEDAWLLSGGVAKLENGIPVAPWFRQITQEWVPIQYVDEVPLRSASGKPGSLFYCRVLAGSPAGKLFETFYSTKFCHWFAERELGFSGMRGKYVFQRNCDIMSLRCYVLLASGKGSDQPSFLQYKMTTSFLDYNKRLIKIRNRDIESCPLQYEHHCYQCPLGYDKCDWGTHPVTYELILCEHCNRESWTDPRKKSLGLCIDCDRAKRMTRQKQ